MSDSQGWQWLNRLFQYSCVGIVSISLWAIPLTVSSVATGYRPPDGGSQYGGPTGGGGTRGCTGSELVPLTALAPASHVGRTLSAHPTFFWYTPEASAPTVEFNLYQVNEAGQYTLVKRETLNKVPGLMSYTLPNSEPGLVEGQQYMWQVLLLCNPDSPSSALRAEAYIERVVSSQQITNAEQLAEAGIWYDALAIALTNPNNPYWLELLNSLAQLEPPSTDERLLSQRDRLQRVIEQER